MIRKRRYYRVEASLDSGKVVVRTKLRNHKCQAMILMRGMVQATIGNPDIEEPVTYELVETCNLDRLIHNRTRLQC